jgi:hypothetical protein
MKNTKYQSLHSLRNPNKSDDDIWIEETGRAPRIEIDKSLFIKNKEEKALLKELKKAHKNTIV